MADLYEVQEWADLPDKTTPISAERLTHIENGIYSNSEGIIANADAISTLSSNGENYASKEIYADTYVSMGRKDGTTIGTSSFAFGLRTTASGNYSHAEGYVTTASGNYSHAEGCSTTVSGNYSHAEGRYTTVSGDYQHVQGKYNAEDTNAAMIIGGGTSTSNQLNIFTVDWDGNLTITGSLAAGSTLLTADDDLDSLTSNGDYEISADAIPANVPSGYGINAGGLKVKVLSNIAYVTQELWEFGDSGVANIWVRSYYSEAWSDWKQAGLS